MLKIYAKIVYSVANIKPAKEAPFSWQERVT